MVLTNTTNTVARTRPELEAKTLKELKELCKTAGVPVTGTKTVLVSYLLEPAKHQKGTKRAATGAPGGQSKAAKAARAMAGPWSAMTDAGGDSALVDATEAEASLRAFVRSCASHVNANWHDCYEETGMILHEYMSACIRRAGAALDVSERGQGARPSPSFRARPSARVSVPFPARAGYDKCLRTMCVVADTWDDMQAIPFRGCPAEDIAQGDYDSVSVGSASFSTSDPAALASLCLPIVLARAAGDARVTDAALQRMLKDCVDHGSSNPHEPSGEEVGLGVEWPDVERVARGRERLAALFADTDAWASLPSWKPKHKMRRGIDRRFDGPKHLRTRDYDSDSCCGGFFGESDY